MCLLVVQSNISDLTFLDALQGRLARYDISDVGVLYRNISIVRLRSLQIIRAEYIKWRLLWAVGP
jgi:hypothetical protein